MDFLERDLEDILAHSNQEEVLKKGLHTFRYDTIYRQLRISGYGVIDLLTIYRLGRSIHITIYELKNKKLNTDAFWQTVRYIKGINYILSEHNLSNHTVYVTGVMIGREIESGNDFCFLPTLDINIAMFTYSYNLDGMKFQRVIDSYYRTAYTGLDLSELNEPSYIQLGRTILTTTPF